MMGITTIPEENLKFIFKDIGDRLLNYYTAEERVKGLASEELVKVLTPEERVKGLAPEERFIGLTPEQRLVGLTSEEKKTLLNALLNTNGA